MRENTNASTFVLILSYDLHASARSIKPLCVSLPGVAFLCVRVCQESFSFRSSYFTSLAGVSKEDFNCMNIVNVEISFFTLVI